MRDLPFALLHVWTSPQKVVQKLTIHPLSKVPALLAALDGTRLAFDLAIANDIGSYFVSQTEYGLTIAILGALVGIALLDLESFLIYVVSNLLGGKGNFTRIRAALALAAIPRLVIVPFYSVLPGFDAALGLIVVIWSLVVLILGLAESLSVSVGRALKILVLTVSPFLVVLAFTLLGDPVFLLYSPIIIGLVVFFSVSGVLINLLMRVGRVPRWLSGWANRRLFESQAVDGSVDDPIYFAKARWVLLPISLSTFFIIFCCLTLFFLFSLLENTKSANLMSSGFYGAGITLLGISGYYHLKVVHLRHIKYELAISGIMLFLFGIQNDGAIAELAGSDFFSRPADLVEQLFAFYPIPVFFLLIFGVLVALMLRRIGNIHRPSRTTAFLYKYSRGSVSMIFGAIGLVLFNQDLAPYLRLVLIFLMVRYTVYDRMLLQPIVYLRSFHSQESAQLLGRVVTETAGREAPVVALTHTLQPPETLLSEMRPDTTARLYVSSDASWQQWVIEHLQHCRAVILDATLMTEGLQWELDQAFKLVDHDRIAVVADQGVERLFPEDVRIITMSIDRDGKRKLMKAMKDWLASLDSGASDKPDD
jgi:hypothetical protein